MTNKQTQAKNDRKSFFIKPFSKMHKGALLYYILSFLVLFLKIFILKNENLSGETYRVAYQEFAYGIGWFYYLANLIGILTVLNPLFGLLQNIATKIIPLVNFVISSILLFKTIPDAIDPAGSIFSFIGKGELAPGFWLILGLHLLAILIFWFMFIRRISKNREKRQAEKLMEVKNNDQQPSN